MRLAPILFALAQNHAAYAEDEPEGPPPPPAEVAVPAPDANPEKKGESWERVGWGFGGIPAVNFNSDEGFGFGAVASVYRYDGKTDPYKWSLDNQIFATTKNVHHHRVIFDALGLAGGKLRLTARVKFEASRAEHYCGLGADVTCDTAVAEQRADDLGLTGDDRDTFLRRYYKMRYVMPYAILVGRWMLRDKPHRLEIFGGWRGNWFLPGDLAEKGPWQDTRYTEDYPDGESGPVSVVQLGFMADNRRNEAAPYSGYWAEASIRGSSRYWGSKPDWEYFGFNVTYRGYLKLLPDDGHLVLADRIVLDGLIGDTNTQDLAWAGGSTLLTMGGGVDSGRGIRQRLYRGKLRAIQQAELRFRYLKFYAGDVPFELGVVGFFDTGMVGREWSDFGKTAPYWGTGGGLRFTMDQNFVIQADLGVSPAEGWSPGVYIETGNTF